MANLGVTSDNKRRCFGTTTRVSMHVDTLEELSNATMATNRFLPRKDTSPLTGLQGTRLFVLFLRNRWNDKVLAVTNKRV